MSVKYKGSWLAAWVIVLAAGIPVYAEGEIEDMQLFAPYESGSFGGGHRASQGFFCNLSALYWSITAPQVASIGISPTPDREVWWYGQDRSNPIAWCTMQGNSLDTSFLSSDFTGGTRLEIGSMEGHTGWMVSWIKLHPETQQYEGNNAQVYFNDTQLDSQAASVYPWAPGLLVGQVFPYGSTVGTAAALGVSFDYTSVRVRSSFWSLEADWVYRMHPTQSGSTLEWQLGPRYAEFKERFDFFGGTDPNGGGSNNGILNGTTISNDAVNRMIGPQAAVRWIKTKDRWSLALRGAFSPMWNAQSIRQYGMIGVNTSSPNFTAYSALAPLAMQSQAFNSSLRQDSFTCMGEFGVEAKYQLTSMATISAGWTGIFMTNVARPAGMIDWTLDTQSMMGIINNKDLQSVFTNGLTIGLEINR